METLIEIITGKIGLPTYAGALFFSVAGFFIMALIDYINRNDKDTSFDFKLWMKENGLFLWLLIITVPMFLRFKADLIVGITKQTGDSLSFIKDEFLWFFLAGLLFRVIFHYGNKMIKKLMSK